MLSLFPSGVIVEIDPEAGEKGALNQSEIFFLSNIINVTKKSF